METTYNKGQLMRLDEIVYLSKSIVSQQLVKKITGNIQIHAFDTLVELNNDVSAFDIFILLLEGIAIIKIDNKEHLLVPQQSFIVPAHSSYHIKAVERFKMLSFIIKSGYE